MRDLLLLSAFAAGLVIGPASAQEGDVQTGRELAERWCSRCHDIGPAVRFKQQPPGFAAVSVYRTAQQVLDRITAPHMAMPDVTIILGGEGIDDIMAYIASLEPAE